MVELNFFKVVCYRNDKKYTLKFDNEEDALLIGQIKYNSGDYDKVEVINPKGIDLLNKEKEDV